MQPAKTSTDAADVCPRTAFISGHIDIAKDAFLEHYQSRLDTATAAGDNFVLSNAGGADSLALTYLLEHDVAPSRITIYIHTPPAHRQQRRNETMRRIDELRTGSATVEGYRQQGLGVKVIDGWHTQRDAEMTRESDYDILWVRPDEETKVLYGSKYRPGRVSGTEKNRLRRIEVEKSRLIIREPES